MRFVALASIAVISALAVSGPSAAQQQHPTLRSVLSSCDAGYQASCQQLNSTIDDEAGDADEFGDCSNQFYNDSNDQVRANVVAWLRGQAQEYDKQLDTAIDDALTTYYHC